MAHISAAFKKDGEELHSIEIARDGALSSQIEELKAQSMAFCNAYMQQHALNMEDVDLTEETVEEEGEEAGGSKPAKGKGKKRKGADKA